MKTSRILSPALLALVLMAIGVTSTTAGNDFIIGNLRVDLPEVYNATRYQVTVAPGIQPQYGYANDFGAGWIGVYLAQYNGQPFSGQFSQVGIKTTIRGIYWFVYAEPGVDCVRGHQDGTIGCYGDVGDIVTLGQWYQLQLVKFSWNNFWIAFICPYGGNCYYLAEMNSDSSRIYWAHSDTEEGYNRTPDPYLPLYFYYYHPQYWNPGTSTWQEWPRNSGGTQISYLEAIPSFICPAHYGAAPYLYDVRSWAAGSGARVCNANLFEFDLYLPAILKNW